MKKNHLRWHPTNRIWNSSNLWPFVHPSPKVCHLRTLCCPLARCIYFLILILCQKCWHLERLVSNEDISTLATAEVSWTLKCFCFQHFIRIKSDEILLQSDANTVITLCHNDLSSIKIQCVYFLKKIIFMSVFSNFNLNLVMLRLRLPTLWVPQGQT